MLRVPRMFREQLQTMLALFRPERSGHRLCYETPVSRPRASLLWPGRSRCQRGSLPGPRVLAGSVGLRRIRLTPNHVGEHESSVMVIRTVDVGIVLTRETG